MAVNQHITAGELGERLREKEAEVQVQLDRIYQLVEEKKSMGFVKIEYRRAVERMTEKYQILVTLAELQKDELSTEEYEQQRKALKDQYKEDIVLLAASIDEAMGNPPSRQVTGGSA